MIWRTAMMSSTNVSGPTRNVISRSSFIDVESLRAHSELAHFFVEAANRVVEQCDRVVHLAGAAAVDVGDGADLLHRGHDLLALVRLAGGDLEDLVDHV